MINLRPFVLTPFLAFASLLSAAIPSYSEEPVEVEPIVVTANRVEEPVSQASVTVSVIGEKELEEKQYLTAPDALKDVSGISIRRLGSIGETTAILMRGSNANGVLSLIDGVKANSPITQSPVLGEFILDEVKQIEVVKGAQSALYGSEAVGGVVHIITKKPEKSGITFTGGIGNLGTHKEKVSLAHVNDRYSAKVSYSHLVSDGQFDQDQFRAHTGTGFFEYAPSETLSITYNGRYIQSSKEIALFCCNFLLGPKGPLSANIVWDENAIFNNENAINALTVTHDPSEKVGYIFKIHRGDFSQDVDNKVDSKNVLIEESKFYAIRKGLSFQQNYYLEKNTVVAGFEHEEEEIFKDSNDNLASLGLGPVGKSRLKTLRHNNSFYLNDAFRYEKVSFNFGVRVDNSNQFGSKANPKASLAYRFTPSTTFKTSYGEGIRSPSIDETHSTADGNPSLAPEENKSFDIGIHQTLFDKKVIFEALYYKNLFDNLIVSGTSPTGGPLLVNLDSSHVYGAEVSALFEVHESFDLSFNYTYQETWDDTSQMPIAFRPKNRLNAQASFHRGDLSLNLMMNTVGASPTISPPLLFPLVDKDGKEIKVGNKEHSLYNLAARYALPFSSLGEKPLFRLRVNNLLNTEYEEARGFPSPGINFLGELSLTF